MTRTKKYLIGLVVIYIVQFAFLAFAAADIQRNGYNPYRAQCGDACFEKLKVDVTVDQSGDATIVEEYHAYRKKANPYIAIDKSFSKTAGESLDHQSVKLESGNGVWAPEFKSDEKNDQVRFRVNTNFTGRQTFRFSYKVKGLIKNLDDGQIFKFNFFNNEYGRKVIDAEFNIKVPSTTFGSSALWFNGLRNQNTIQKNESVSTYSVKIPSSEHTKQFFEANIAFQGHPFYSGRDVATMPYQTLNEFNDNIEKIKNEDMKLENNVKALSVVLFIANIVLCVIVLVVLSVIYLLKEKPYRRMDKESAYWNIPMLIGPLVAAMVIDKNNKADLNNGFKAGILYLVSRGYAKMEDEAGGVVLTKLADIVQGEPDEVARLHKFLFNNRDQIRLTKDTKLDSPNEILDFSAYKTGAIDSFRSMGIFEKPKGGYKAERGSSSTFKGIAVVVVIAIVSIVMLGSSNFSAGMILSTASALIMSAILLVIYAVNCNRIKAEQIVVFEQWYGYKNYLSNYTLLKERGINDLALWKQHLVYATAFGVAENVLKVLKAEYPDVATALEIDIPIMTGFYFSPHINTTSFEGSRSFGDFGGFGGGGSFGGGDFSGGGSGGGGGFL